jgi:hypothetical protein
MVSASGDGHMRGGIVPSALLFASLGLALTFSPRNIWTPSLLVLLATLMVLTFLPMPRSWLEGVFLGCWISVLATAGSLQLFHKIAAQAALILSINAGVWASAVAHLSGSRSELLEALPCVLILWPASWIAGRYGAIPLKVVSSWIIAIAALSGTLQLLPVTPGYLPDHLE